jgi:plasmid stabilization system protein ParE
MKLEFHSAAEAEFLEVVGYYESRVPGLGNALIEEMEALLELINQTPKAWQVEAEPDIRKAPFQRFPISLIYRQRGNNFQVLAVAHDRRRPQYWIERV